MEENEMFEESEMIPAEGEMGTDNSLRLYFHGMSQYSMLSAEDEYALAGRVANGDQEAKNQLVEANLRLVISIAKHYRGCGLTFQDLIQEGNIGLIKATERFDRDKGFRFCTYAAWWVKQSIVRAIGESRTVRVPANINEQINKVRQMERQLRADLGHEPSVEEIAEAMNMKVSHITDLYSYMANTESLDQQMGDEDSDATLGSFIEDKTYVSPEANYIKANNRDIVNGVLDTLSEREGEILRYRFGLKDGTSKTLEEVGNIYGITKERVRQLEAKALRKLRDPRRAAILRDCLMGED